MPARKPTQTKKTTGTLRRDRLKNEPEPQVPSRTPQAPRHLPDAGRELWRRLAPTLRATRVLTIVDVHALEVLCLAYARARQAGAMIDEDGLLVDGSQGQPVRSPAVSAELEYLNLLRVMFQAFGLTPASRGGIDLPAAERKESLLDQFLSGGELKPKEDYPVC